MISNPAGVISAPRVKREQIRKECNQPQFGSRRRESLGYRDHPQHPTPTRSDSTSKTKTEWGGFLTKMTNIHPRRPLRPKSRLPVVCSVCEILGSVIHRTFVWQTSRILSQISRSTSFRRSSSSKYSTTHATVAAYITTPNQSIFIQSL